MLGTGLGFGGGIGTRRGLNMPRGVQTQLQFFGAQDLRIDFDTQNEHRIR